MKKIFYHMFAVSVGAAIPLVIYNRIARRERAKLENAAAKLMREQKEFHAMMQAALLVNKNYTEGKYDDHDVTQMVEDFRFETIAKIEDR